MSLLQASGDLKSFISLMSAAIVLIGLGELAILPPFEGMDEPHHYSGIRQIADGHKIPVTGQANISPDVIDYRQYGPMPYGMPVTHKSRALSFGGDEIITYADFFSKPAMIADYLQRYRSAGPRVPYVPETEQYNWESQHPPLYNILLAPLMKAGDHLSFVGEILLLRLASFALAFAGLFIAMRATLKFSGSDLPARFIAMGFMLYPFLAPAFFTEFGRLGQDSLCLFLFGIAWDLILRWRHDKTSKKSAIALGVCFGFGLLTKILFLPVVAGFFLYALWHSWLERRKASFMPRLLCLALIAALTILISGGWYIYQYINFGSPTGSLALIKINQHGGLLANLHDHFAPLNFSVAVYSALMTWLLPATISAPYTGTWLDVPVYVLVVWLIVNYIRAKKNAALARLPLWFVFPFLAALLWHLVIFILQAGNGIGGWYMHILAPAVAVIMGVALQRLAQSRAKRILLFGLLGFSVIFLAAVFWSQISLFTGCAVKKETDVYFQFPGASYCFDHLPAIASHLAVIGFPWLTAIGFGGGFVCLIAGLFRMRNLVRA